MYNQHTRGMATTRHRSLVERGGRKAFVRDRERRTKQNHKKGEGGNVRKKTDIHESKEKDSST